MRVLSEKGENLGVMSKDEALKLAVDRGLDLIEISPNAKPPVTRIMSFDKLRYELGKKRKQERALGKNKELKQIQISVREARHDLEIKAKRIDDFLSEGHPVAVVLNLRGREKANKDFARMKLDEFLKLITVDHQRPTDPPRWGGRGFTVQITKK